MLKFMFYLMMPLCGPKFCNAYGWFSSQEMDLFDLVEEVKQNFYEFMNVTEDATQADLKKSFRRLSLVLHPDKNPSEDAEVRFRQLVAIYEVLKDKDRRERYNQVLVEGLPDWKTPMFYFRRARKMDISELTVLLVGILTLGHYLMSWGSYVEKKWVRKNEWHLGSSNTKSKKKKKKAMTVSDQVTEVEEDERPKFRDLLPFLVVRGLYSLVTTDIPLMYAEAKAAKAAREAEKKEAEEEEKRKQQRQEEEEIAAQKRKEARRNRGKNKFRELNPELEEVYEEQMRRMHGRGSDEESTDDDDANTKPRTIQAGGFWTDDDFAQLAKLMKRYPGGTPQRWEKIAEQMCRTVFEAKRVKEDVYRAGVGVALQGITGQEKGIVEEAPEEAQRCVEIGDGQMLIRTVDGSEEVVQIKREKRKTRPKEEGSDVTAAEGSEYAGEPWEQVQQKALEMALTRFPKGTEERWERIAKCVEGKTKEQCIQRYKWISEMVKKRKTANLSDT
ncbi:unnamed protein product [Cyprideis torosa]|uniref:Uncharacterized protein n=1 Tax=Cyprideis torosa TaxID=163714 RepID=A0A7R8WCA0_9CRUS|nr:unnamed protein product [Cyprideis torosa]CAG0891779.1 unnamed protein product [Cyprideis torosa]